MMRDTLRAIRDEPAMPDPSGPGLRDWTYTTLVVTASLIEGLLRPDVPARALSIVLTVSLALTLLWRRTHPLLMVALAFGAFFVVDLLALLTGGDPVGLYSVAGVVLVLPYALLRWGSGRQVVLGLEIIVAFILLAVSTDFTTIGEAIAGFTIALLPAAIGAAVRFQVGSRTRELEQAKLLERQQLARELHDTVAHHVSAIAIQAQAGQAVAAQDANDATESLRRIEEEATRTLREMRAIVGALREEDDAAQLTPQRGVADIEALASGASSPLISVELAGDLDALPVPVDAALYRLAEESVTNAVTHARNATRIEVTVVSSQEGVRLMVTDDGEGPASRSSHGFGIAGMAERVALLGGHLEVGPDVRSGWYVKALIPRDGQPA